ncbi:hypothetical protein WDV85_06345 [Pseudokineococcus sp. 5B2Z-1]|uniref:hypothetical protein n=1 Tax=Pseudokineococcus sp. 5B2Z-1 TaxID=3132744 RepID=UPI0030B75367
MPAGHDDDARAAGRPPVPPSGGGGRPLAQLPDALVTGAMAGLGTVAWGLLVSVVLLVVGVAAGAAAGAAEGAGAGGPVSSAADLVQGASVLLAAPWLALGAALGARLALDVTSTAGGGEATLVATPLLLTALVLAGAVLASWLGERRRPSRGPSSLWLASAASAAVAALVTTVACAVTAVRASSTEDGTAVEVELTAAGPRLLLVGFLLVLTAAAAGRALARPRGDRLTDLGVPRAVSLVVAPGAAAGALLVGGLLAVSAVVALVTVPVVAEEDRVLALALAPWWLGHAAVAVAAVALPGAVAGSVAALGSTLAEDLDVLSPQLPAAAPALVLLPAALAVLVGCRAGLRAGAPGRRRSWSSAWVAPTTALLVGVVMAALAAVDGRGSATLLLSVDARAEGSVLPVTVLALLLWAVVVEVAARTLAGPLAASAPGFARRLAGPDRLEGPSGGGVEAPGRIGQATLEADGVAERYDGSAATASPAGAAPSTGRRRAALVTGVLGGGLVLLVAAVVAHGVLQERWHGPQVVAEDYLRALAAGSADEAAGIVDPDVDSAQRWLLTDEVLAEATALPTDVRVDDVAVEGDVAAVTASYALDGVRQSVDLVLRRDGRTGVVFDRWRLDTPLVGSVELVVPDDAQVVRVSGADVEINGGAQVSLPAYPGVYEAAVLTGSPYLAAVPVPVSTADAAEAAGLQVEATPELGEEVQRQVDDLVEQCAEEAVIDPEGCPFDAYEYRAQDVEWSVERLPVVDVERTSSLFGGSSWSLTTLERGAMSYTARVPSGFFLTEELVETTGEADVVVSGDVVVTGDDVVLVLSPW